MENNSRDWKRFSDQEKKCTRHQIAKLNKPENRLALKAAMAEDDIGKAQDVFISIIEPSKKLKYWEDIQKENQEFKKQLKELLGEDLFKDLSGENGQA